MSLPENKEILPNRVLDERLLLKLFEYLDFETLKSFRVTCSWCYGLMWMKPELSQRFFYRLELGSEIAVDSSQSPFSIISGTKFEIEKLTFLEGFLNASADTSCNSQKLQKLSEIKIFETVSNIIIKLGNRDYENALLFLRFMQKCKKLKSIRISLSTFAPVFEKFGTSIPSVESISVEMFETRIRSGTNDFQLLLEIFPNTTKIHIYTTTDVEFDTNIIRNYAPLIKTISNLSYHGTRNIQNLPDLKLERIEFRKTHTWSSNFIRKHPEIQSYSISIAFDVTLYIDFPLSNLTELHVLLTHKTNLCVFLYNTPNLKKLQVEFKNYENHNFGHEVVEMKKLTRVELMQYEKICDDCFFRMLQSFKGVKELMFKNTLNPLDFEEILSISEELKNLEFLHIHNDLRTSVNNFLEQWPQMRKLTRFVLNKVGILTEEGIRRLKFCSPSLHTIHLYHLHAPHILDLVQVISECFPHIKSLTLRGGDTKKIDGLGEIFTNSRESLSRGWCMKSLDITPEIGTEEILELFRHLELLQTVTCRNGGIIVTRRMYFEVDVLKSSSLDEMIKTNQKRKN